LSNQWIAFRSGDLSVEVNPLGAQLSVLRDAAGRDLMWNGDPSVWAGRAPLLFPIVGALAEGTYRVGSTSYRLPRHGFARTSAFQIADASASGAFFLLQADTASRQLYPFAFELEVRYALDAATLTIAMLVRNRGESTMAASFGYHPAFRWPLPYGRSRADHRIEFTDEEPAPVRRLDTAGLLLPERFPTPVEKRRLALSDALFENDVLIFDALRSRSVTYGAEDGRQIRLDFPDAPYLGVWSKPGAEFVCIEPWHGIADPRGFSGDFTAKPGVFTVAPGDSMETRITITLLP
jgi:galactose mutarotase-like enzyme